MSKVTGGNLEYTATIDTDQMRKSVKETEKVVEEMTKAVAKGGEGIDKTISATSENIKIQKQVIQGLEDDLKALNKQIDAMAPGRMKAGLIGESKALEAEIQAEKRALTELEQQVKGTEVAHTNLSTELRKVKQEMMELEAAGKGNTAEFRALEQSAQEMQDAIQTVNSKVQLLNGQSGFRGTLALLSGVAGGFSAAQGAIGLFSGENENLQKIMLKVQSLMAITIGLQEVQNTLNKKSAFQIGLVTKAKNALAVAETRLATALRLTNIQARALMATMSLGLTLAIAAAIELWSDYSAKQEEIEAQNKSLRESTAEMASASITAFKDLQGQWESLGDSLAERKKFIEENQKAFSALGVEVENVTDAENLFIKNSDAFVRVLMLRAKAAALAEMSAKKYRESVELDLEAEQEFNKESTYLNQVKDGWYELFNGRSKVAVLQEEALDRNKEAYDLGLKEKALTEEIASIYKEMGFNEVNTAKEKDKISKSTQTKQEDPFIKLLNERKKAYDEFNQWMNSQDPVLQKTAKAEFDALLKEGNNYLEFLENLRERLVAKGDTKNLRKVNTAIANAQEETALQAFQKALDVELKSADSIIEKLELVAAKKKELLNDNTELDNSKAAILKSVEQDALDEAKAYTDALIKDYAGYLDYKIELERKFNDDIILLNERLLDAKTEQEKQHILKALEERRKLYENQSKLTGDTEYDALVRAHMSFEEKKLAITEEYQAKIGKALEHGNQELADRLKEQLNNELSSLTLDELKNNDDWKIAFEGLEKHSRTAVKKAIDNLRKLAAEMLRLGQITEAEYATIMDGLNSAAQKVDTDFDKIVNDWEKVTKSFKDGEGDIDALGGALKSTSDILNSMGQDAISIFENISGESGEMAAQVLGDVTNLMTGFGELAEGIASMNPAAIISGVAKVVKTMSDWISGDRKRQREIEKHEAAINALAQAYNQLSYEINNALGNKVFDYQLEQVQNLIQQRQTLEQMRQQEERKKKTDQGAVNAYNQQIQDINNTINDIFNNIQEQITQTNAKDLANQIGDALVDAFGRGESAAVAMGNVVDDVLRNAVLSALKRSLLEEQLERVVSDLRQSMGFNSDGTGSYDGLTEGEIAHFQQQIEDIYAPFQDAIEGMPDLFGPGSSNASAMTGAIQGVSQETAGMIEGIMNVMSMRQAEMLSADLESKLIMQNIESHLLGIKTNTDALHQISADIAFIRSTYNTTTREI